MAEKTNSKALKSGVWYTISNFTVKAMAFLTMPIFNRIMTKQEVGDFANFSSWLVILAVIVSGDLYSSVAIARYEYKDRMYDYIASNLALGSSITIVFYGIVLIFKSFFLNLFGFSELELHLCFLYAMVSPALQMFQIQNRMEYKYKSLVFVSLSSTFAATLISLLCATLMQDKLFGRLIGYYAPIIVFNCCLYLWLIFKSQKISWKYWKFALTISLPLVWHTLSANLLNSSDRVMIRYFRGLTDTAHYNVAYSCAFAVSILWTSMNMAWAPWAYEKMNENDHSALKKASKPYLLFFGICVFAFLLIAPELLLIMGGPAYIPSLGVIPPVMTAYVFQFAYSLYVNIETFSKKQKYIAIGTTIAAGVNIFLNLIFINIFGYIAAAYTTLAGYIVLFAIHYCFVRKLKKTHFYDTKFIFIYLAVFIAIMLVTICLYKFNIVRYIVIGVLVLGMCIFIWSFRKEITYSIKNRSFHSLIQAVNNKMRWIKT